MVGKWGQGDVLPLPPSVVRRLVAVVWRDRAFVEEGWHLVDLSLPPPPPARRLAAAVSVHCPLAQPPPVRHRAAAARRVRDTVVGGRPGADRLLPLLAVARRPVAVVLAQFPLPPPEFRRPTAAAWQDRQQMRGGRNVVNLLPPPPLVVRRLVAAAWGVWGTASVRWQLGVVGKSAPPVPVEPPAAADLVLAAMLPSVATCTTVERASWAETRSEEELTKQRHDLAEDV